MKKVVSHIFERVVLISLPEGQWIAENYDNIISLLFIRSLQKYRLYVLCLRTLLCILTLSERSLVKRVASFR